MNRQQIDNLLIFLEQHVVSSEVIDGVILGVKHSDVAYDYKIKVLESLKKLRPQHEAI